MTNNLPDVDNTISLIYVAVDNIPDKLNLKLSAAVVVVISASYMSLSYAQINLVLSIASIAAGLIVGKLISLM